MSKSIEIAVNTFWRIALSVLLLCAANFAQQTTMPRPTGERPLNERIAIFEGPDRDAWQKPEEVIKALELKNGMVVADIGAGSGYFARRLAKAVAPKGTVYAVDIAEDILEYLTEEAKKQNLNNIEIIVSKEDDPLLAEDLIDLAFFADTTHHIANRINFYRKVRKALKKDGRMAIIDIPPVAHEKGFCPHKPEELLPREQAIKEAEEAGFKLIKEFTFIREDRSYFLLFQKIQHP